MDLFKYKVALAELNACKLVKDLEELVRKYTSSVPTHAYQFEPHHIYYYKLLTLSLKLFKDKTRKTLPLFVYDRHLEAQKSVLSSLFEAELLKSNKSYYASKWFTKEPTYEGFMDYFEFDTHIDLHSSSWYVEKLNHIIDNKPIHFSIKFNYSMDSFDEHSTTIAREQQALVYSIRYKRVNFPTKSQTVWDLFIKDNRAACVTQLDSTKVDESILKLQQQIKALKALEGYLV